MDSKTAFEFLVAGGGTAGCVLASRLSLAGFSVAMFETGPQDYSEQVMAPLAAPTLHGSPLEYNFLSKGQQHLSNRRIPNFGGRILSGSSAVNYANWTRCHSADYNAWAALVGDERWSYHGLLHYFQKVDKVMHTTKGSREYPLKEPLQTALLEAGLQLNTSANDGNPLGFAALTENWKDGKRQPAGIAYDISKVSVYTEVVVKRVLFDEKRRAKGIELLDGRVFTANREVLVCCGSIKTPQLLMLSGVGPQDQLASHGIPIVADLPVGEGLHDHLSATMYFKLKRPELGLAIGSSRFSEMAPDFQKGNPIDWIITESIKDPSRAAKVQNVAANDPLLAHPRGHVEFFVSYAPIAAPAFFDYSLAGTHISTPILGLLPTSRGSISLANTDPTEDPIIDPNYLDSEMDREAMRTGVRTVLHTMLDTAAGRSIIQEETPPPGQSSLSSSSSDSEIDERIAAVGRSFYQCAGTAAMGKVVDTTLRVKGVEKLRVVDASVLPMPLAGHYQYPVYAIAEHAADIVLSHTHKGAEVGV